LTERQVRILNAGLFATVATLMPDGSPEATLVSIQTRVIVKVTPERIHLQ
jgi:hypothetical protein